MTRNELGVKVLAYIEAPEPDPLKFERLALEVFQHQVRNNSGYRRLLEMRGTHSEEIRAWNEIPSASTTAFKRLRLVCGSSALTFRTSGTTGGSEIRGEHHIVDPVFYRAALRRQFKKFMLPDLDRIAFLTLTPAPSWAPDSSLGFMMADVHSTFGIGSEAFFLGPDGVDLDRLIPALRAAEAAGAPVCIAGVAFAFVNLLDALRERGVSFRLPAGSRIMDTGGFKGRSRSVERVELLIGFRDNLGIFADKVVSEYGMTELSSQFYDATIIGGNPKLKLGPHWVRTEVVDPVTGAPQSDGEIGLLRHYDLANVDSVLAVETEDLGVRYGEGFELIGRIAGAEARGCSLVVPDPPPC